MLLLVPAAIGSAQQFDYAGSLAATRGTFIFDAPTTSWVLDQTVGFGTSRWRLSASVPIVMQNSTALTWIGSQPLPTGGPNAGTVRGRTAGGTVPTQRRRAGSGGSGTGAALMASAITVDSGYVEAPGAHRTVIGDPVIGGELSRATGRNGAGLFTVRLQAKLPVATLESGVGTGQLDAGAGLAASVAVRRVLLFADVSHWRLGDLPDLPLRDLTTGAAGVGVTLGAARRVSLLADVSASSAVIAHVDAPVSAGLGLGFLQGEGRSFTVSATAGLSESTPAWRLAVGWRLGRMR